MDRSEKIIKISFFVKSAVECYREGGCRDMCLHAKLFVDGWVPLRMARKEQMKPLAVEPKHW